MRRLGLLAAASAFSALSACQTAPPLQASTEVVALQPSEVPQRREPCGEGPVTLVQPDIAAEDEQVEQVTAPEKPN